MKRRGRILSSLVVIALAFLLMQHSYTDVARAELVGKCEANIKESLGDKAGSLHPEITQLCETINLIPQDTIDDQLASWILSTYREKVGGQGVDPMDISSIRERINLTARLAEKVCPLITEVGTYYKNRSKELISDSREIKEGIFATVKKRIAEAPAIKINVGNASPFDSVKIISESFDVRVNNTGNNSDWYVDYSGRIESDIIGLALVRSIYESITLSIAHDQNQYAVSLFTLVLYTDENNRKELGLASQKYSDLKPKIMQFIDRTIYLNDEVLYIDWGNLKYLLDDGRHLMWRDNHQVPFVSSGREIIYEITPGEDVKRLLEKTDLDIFHSMIRTKGRDNSALLQSLGETF